MKLDNLHEAKQNLYPTSTFRPTKMYSSYHHFYSKYLFHIPNYVNGLIIKLDHLPGEYLM